MGCLMGKIMIIIVILFAFGNVISGENIYDEDDDIVVAESPWRIHTLFSTECNNYFDWQTVGLMHSYRKSGQPGGITRLLSCTEEEMKEYKGLHLAPTLAVPSMSIHPRTGDRYTPYNKPAGILHWLEHSEEAKNVDWVIILDADMIIRGPIIPWELGAQIGRPVASSYNYLIGCENILAELHTKNPELCDKVGVMLVMHIDDLRAVAPLWLSKTEEVREDKAHWGNNITGDESGNGWISEMYGYSFGAADVGLRHKITEDLMLYPGYIPPQGIEPIVFHYGLPFNVGNWSFTKRDYNEDGIVYDCGRLFPVPPYPKEVRMMEADLGKRRSLMLSIECMNMLNEALLLHHNAVDCPTPKWSRYLSFLKSTTYAQLTLPKRPGLINWMNKEGHEEEMVAEAGKPHPKIHTIFSTECSPYFDWQTVGLMHSFRVSGQPGNITRLLSCTDEKLKDYKGHDLAPTHYAPSLSKDVLTGDRYPAINKPASILHWLHHAQIDAEYIIILDPDMLFRSPITPWEFQAARGRPVGTPYHYLIGCNNILAKLHTRNPEACDKVGVPIIIHIEDLQKLALYWLLKTQEVRADKEHYAKEITGDVYESGWISEMYGYTFGAAELNLRHIIDGTLMMYPGNVPQDGINYKVFHYGLEFKVGNWRFDKAYWRIVDLVNDCWAKFPDPPDPSTLNSTDKDDYNRDLHSLECARTLNEALYLHHKKRKCPDPNSFNTSVQNELSMEKTSRNIIESNISKNSSGESINSGESSTPPAPGQLDSSIRILVVGLWVVSFMGFLLLMAKVFSGKKRPKTKSKHKNRKKSSDSGSIHLNE